MEGYSDDVGLGDYPVAGIEGNIKEFPTLILLIFQPIGGIGQSTH